MEKYISYKYDKNSLYNVRMRYEFYKNKEKRNCYIYFNNWNNFLTYYNNINKNNRHFYEMFDDKIKFFLDIDCKEDYYDWQWDHLINKIKNKLINFINNILCVTTTKIIRCDSKFVKDEYKRSCHLIVENFNFETKYCKELYNLFIVQIDEDIKKYIDNQVYGENRCLRIIGSSKIGSKRIKYDFENIHDVSLKHFVSNIDNTIFVETYKYYKPLKLFLNIDNKINKKIELNYNITKYLEIIKIVHNNFNESLPFFKIRKNGIRNNMIICDIIRAYHCKNCNRIHELENPFIIISEITICFYCRRSNLPIEIKYK